MSTPLYDPKVLRRTFGSFATGVTVVSVGGEQPHGMTASAFSPVSLDPPLVLICVDRNAELHRLLLSTGSFAVSVLASEQEGLARYFADKRRPLGLAQLDGVDWRPGPHTGAPLIQGALAHFECETWEEYDGGDHTIFIGRLLALKDQGHGEALLFHGGRFGRISAEPDEVAA